MLYYSEKNKKFYKSEDELVIAEKEYDEAQLEAEKKAEEKKVRAKEVEAAYKHAQEVRKAASDMIKEADDDYYKLRNAFVKDYGSFHMSFFDDDAKGDDTISTFSKILLSWPW